MRWSFVPALLLVACSSSTAPTPPARQTGKASAVLKLNGDRPSPLAYGSCNGGLFFSVSLDNETTGPIAVQSYQLAFTHVQGGQGQCWDHPAPFDPAVSMTVPAGITSEVRRVDLAGDLCRPPSGAPGCQWLAKATLTTSYGVLTDELGFWVY